MGRRSNKSLLENEKKLEAENAELRAKIERGAPSGAPYQKPDVPPINSSTPIQSRFSDEIDSRPERLLEEGSDTLQLPNSVYEEIEAAGMVAFFPLSTDVHVMKAQGWITYTDLKGDILEVPSKNPERPGETHVLMLLPKSEKEAGNKRDNVRARAQTKAIKDKFREGDKGGDYYVPNGARF